MTDVWVSTKKHYCDVCKCWVIGNSTNIKNHEASARHIGSLRRRIVESYRKDAEKKQQELMENEELERLNQITMENGKVVNPLVSNKKVTNEILELTANKLYPAVDRETEMRRVMSSISKSLLGQQDTNSLELGKTKWRAFVDTSDGTLCYFNNQTGHKTKVRPADFDGVLPSASAALTANWSLKFEPNKRRYYYHNSDTGEVRWLEDNIVGIAPQPEPQYEETSNITSDKTRQDASRVTDEEPETQEKSQKGDCGDGQVPEDKGQPLSAEPTVKIKHGNGTEQELNPYDNIIAVPTDGVKYEAPMIGAWQVVEEKDGAFGNCIQSMEPYLNPPTKLQTDDDDEVNVLDSVREDTFQSDLLNQDDLRPVGKVANTLFCQEKDTQKEMIAMQKMKSIDNRPLSISSDSQVSDDAMEVIPFRPKAKLYLSLYSEVTTSNDAKKLPKVRKRSIHLTEATLGLFNSPHHTRDELCRLLDRVQGRVDTWKPSQILQCLFHAVDFYATNFGLQHKLLTLLKKNLLYLSDSQVSDLLSRGFSNVDLAGVSVSLILPQMKDAPESKRVKLCVVQGEVLMTLLHLYTIRTRNAFPCKERIPVLIQIQSHLLNFVTSLPSLYKWEIVGSICSDLLDYCEEYSLASAKAFDSVVNALCARVLNLCAQEPNSASDVMPPPANLCKDLLLQQSESRIQYNGVNVHALRIFVDCIIHLEMQQQLHDDPMLTAMVNRVLLKCLELKTIHHGDLKLWFGCIYKASCLSRIFPQHRNMLLAEAIHLATSYEGNKPQMVSMALGMLLNSNESQNEINENIPMLFHKLYKVQEIENATIFDIVSKAWIKHRYFHHACGTWLFDLALRRTPRTRLDSLILALLYGTQKHLPYNISGPNTLFASANATTTLFKYDASSSRGDNRGCRSYLKSRFAPLKCEFATLDGGHLIKYWRMRNQRIHRIISRLLF